MNIDHLHNGDFVVSDRGGIVENRHLVHAAVVGCNREDRSAAKPVQAIPAIESGALEQFDFDEADLALMCGSHNGEERHAERARNMLAKLQVKESELQCCGHPSIFRALTETWTRNGFIPSPAYSACSGNHIGVMAGAKAIGTNITGYHTLAHPIQTRTTADDVTKYGNDSTSPRTQAMARVYNAMTRYPENIGGEERFCSALNGGYSGALMGKSGAEACYAIAWRDWHCTKIEDGHWDVMAAAAAEILEQLQIGTREKRGNSWI
ncbi:thermolabile L-asparaginase, partial [Xylaria nigripes]